MPKHLTIIAVCVGLAQFHLSGALPKEISIPEILDLSSTVTSETYPNADLALIDSVSFETYNSDGTSVMEDDSFSKILTEKGRKDSQTASFHFSAAYQTMEILCAQIIKPNSEIIEIDANRFSRVVTEPCQVNSNIYDPAQKVLKISFPSLEIGDIVRCRVRQTTFKARVSDAWSDYGVFEFTFPIIRYSYFISAPDELPLQHIRLRDKIDDTVQYSTKKLENNRTLHHWEISNVPQLFEEPSMPAPYTVSQRLLTSTIKDWQEISRWYWNLSKPRLEETTAEMTNLVQNILSSRPAEQSPTDVVFRWVSQNVRYMGVTTEKEAPGYEPHSVSMTFSNRYGVCRDKAALLVSLLRIAGIDAFPVLIHAGEKRDPEVPMTFFNHAIVGVRQDNGEYLLMDPTNENTKDLLPAYLDDKSYLAATPEGETLRTSPLTPAARNMLKISSRARLTQDDSLLINSVILFQGVNDTLYRSALAGLSEKKRFLFFEGLFQQRIAGAKLTELKISPKNIRDTSLPLAVEADASVSNFATRGDDAMIINLPWLSPSLGYVNFIIAGTGLKKRRFPLETDVACGVVEDILIETESLGSPLSIPPPAECESDGISFQLSVKAEKNRISAKRLLAINNTSIPPQAYTGFKETLAKIETASRQLPIFVNEERTDACDSKIISFRKHCEIISPESWRTKTETTRQILTYAGAKDHSEIAIPYNPVWQTVNVISATVSNSSGQISLLQPHEINIMDAPWCAAAPRYSAEKVMVISLPNVQIGSTIETTIACTVTNAPFFHAEVPFVNNAPVEQAEFAISAIDELARRVKTQICGKDMSVDISESDGIRTVKYSAQNLPAIPKEDALPPPYALGAAVYASTGDWGEYIRSVSNAFEAAMTPEKIKSCTIKAGELTKGISCKTDKIRIIRDFIATNTRLAGPSFTKLPLHVSPPDLTLADGYGNTLDRAALLYAMLEAVDLAPTLILADTLPEDVGGCFEAPRETLPSPDTFQIPLVALSDSIILNDTDQYAPLGSTAATGRRTMRVIGSTNLDRVEVKPQFETRHVTMTTVNLEKNGDAQITVTNEYYGIAAARIIRKISEMSPEHLRRHHLELANEISVSAETNGPFVTEFTHDRAKVIFSVSVKRYATLTDGMMTLALDAPPMLPAVRSDRRESAMEFKQCEREQTQLTVILPAEADSVVVRPPDMLKPLDHLGMRGGLASQTSTVVRTDDGRLQVHVNNDRIINRAIIPPEIYPAYLQINRQISNNNNKFLVFRLK